MGYADAVAPVGVRLLASEAARIRALWTGATYVHAIAEGTVTDAPLPPGAERLRYRVTVPGFRVGPEERVVTAAESAWFSADGTAWCTGAS
ncbi:hypothetical protein [Methylobacterium sp. Leaf86]|uniref:hypothetical protein n=1 Tax=Methylobacterium sp. Leaf86 TaxID=1736242 RepID=UPI001FCDE837|nr:hypothetical protein [Methylobacterium sp. Leaf86]